MRSCPIGFLFSFSHGLAFNFKKRPKYTESFPTQAERCRKVHIDACIHSDAQCSTRNMVGLRLSSAKYMTSTQIGFHAALCPGSDMTAYQCSSMLCQGSMYMGSVRIHQETGCVPSGCVALILNMRMRVSVTGSPAARCVQRP